MERLDNTLDFEAQEKDFVPELVHASGGTRFANFFIDRIIVMLLFFGTVYLIGDGIYVLDVNFSFIMLIMMVFMYYIGYFWFFEATTGKTPAKWLTKTRVVNRFGKRATLWQLLGRTLARYIPFEPFSFFGPYSRGWHDSLSGTWVVDEQKMGISK